MAGDVLWWPDDAEWRSGPATAKQVASLTGLLTEPEFETDDERKLNRYIIRKFKEATALADLPGPPDGEDSYRYLTAGEAHELILGLREVYDGGPDAFVDTCKLCGRGNRTAVGTIRSIVGGYCDTCLWYVAQALGRDGDFQSPIEYVNQISPIVRHHGPICYICGQVPSDVAEHVVPKARGGPDIWANLGGACHHCNLEKGDRPLEMTPTRQERLTVHQASVQTALDAILADPIRFWLAWFDEMIELAAEDLKEALGEGDELDEDLGYVIEFLSIDDFDFTEYPLIPRTLVPIIAEEILSRLRG